MRTLKTKVCSGACDRCELFFARKSDKISNKVVYTFILYLTYKKRVVVNIKPFHNECKHDSLSHSDTHTHTHRCVLSVEF